LSLQRALAQLRHPAFREGAADLIGPALGVGAWGLVTGVAMVKSGMSVWLALLMSLAGLRRQRPAGGDSAAGCGGAPVGGVAHGNLRQSAFRHFQQPVAQLFSIPAAAQRLAIGYFSGDVIFVAFMKRFPRVEPGPDQVPVFLGAASLNWLAWQIPSVAGILLANEIPLSWGLGFCRGAGLAGCLAFAAGRPRHLGCHGRGCDVRPWLLLRCRSSSISWWPSPQPLRPAWRWSRPSAMPASRRCAAVLPGRTVHER
jgi:hypothetical protein